VARKYGMLVMPDLQPRAKGHPGSPMMRVSSASSTGRSSLHGFQRLVAHYAWVDRRGLADLHGPKPWAQYQPSSGLDHVVHTMGGVPTVSGSMKHRLIGTDREITCNPSLSRVVLISLAALSLSQAFDLVGLPMFKTLTCPSP